MKQPEINIKRIKSIKELHAFMDLPSPLNPLLTIIDHSHTQQSEQNNSQKLLLDFYNISIKRSFKGKLKYGKNHYDFDDGTMSFIAPNQIISVDNVEERDNDGWSLLFYPDLIRQYPLGKAIKDFGCFSYDVNEALHLSDEEEKTIELIVQNIQREISSRIDNYSQDVMVNNLELLLSYCNRFYNRQFITRKMATNDLLINFEQILDKYFIVNSDSPIPTVEKIATELNVSPSYLSDMLRNLTGQNTQQHIHEKLIEKAKDILTTTNFTVSEIAYQLGFEHPQSFSRLFKNKVNMSPLAFRASFN
jgi:AraC family transcriptional regulator, transcriptional activator of pobA